MTGGWTPRWSSLLESFGWPVRSGSKRRPRITDLRAGVDGIEAKVRIGESESTVRISLLPFPSRVFDAAIRTMAGKARFAASLLSGRIPLDVESAFAGTGRTLLPASPQEMRISCTCSRGTGCEHVEAILPHLGERFDRDPFLLFELRGMKREELLARLKRHRSGPKRREGAKKGTPPLRPLAREPLPEVRPEAFFKPLRPLGPPRPLLVTVESGDSMLSRLGPGPFEDPQATELLLELHRAIGLGARERLSEWEWRKIGRPRIG